MARLNEPPPAVESVEALKRRFIRQNREIARTNSTQSLRIRTLEAETSRLLSENITLREENIQLKQELARGQSKYALNEVSGVRGKLEEKLAELNALVIELKDAESAQPLPTPPKGRAPKRSSLQRSPNMRNVRDPFTYTDVDAAEGRLPPIDEDANSPERTLGATNFHGFGQDSNGITDSPELGPPPIAHFDEGDPVKRVVSTSTTLAESPSIVQLDGSEDSDPTAKFFANLETRRKRKYSSSIKTVDNSSSAPQEPSEAPSEPTQAPVRQPLKAGAKRKLAVREDEEKDTQKLSQKDDFAFSRRSNNQKSIAKEVSKSKSEQEPPSRGLKTERPRSTTPSNLANRKALGEKSVNTDPVTSPAKTKTNTNGKLPENKRTLPRNYGRHDLTAGRKLNVQRDRPAKGLSEPKFATFEITDLSPITPAPADLDLFSPESSAPPTAEAGPRDTPPPSNIGDGAMGRASRRRGNNVSYAEPNLRDKMRRPGKELVAAVTDTKLSRSMSGKSDSEDKSKPDDASVKQEETDKPLLWRTSTDRKEPTSPLEPKSTTSASKPFPSDPRERRRVSGSYRPNDTGAEGASSATIAALVAGSQKRLSRAREIANEKSADGDVPRDSSSVFDFRPSSPESSSEKQEKVSRRHSNMSDFQNQIRLGKADELRANQSKSTLSVGRSARRRDTVALDTGSEVDVSADVKLGEDEGKGSMRAARAERRRSMMV